MIDSIILDNFSFLTFIYRKSKAPVCTDNIRNYELTFHSFHGLEILAIFNIGGRIENLSTEYWIEFTGEEGELS